jgi:cell division protein FtsN
MKPRFRPREALVLYLVLLVCVAVLFLVGLELGRDRMTAASAQPRESVPTPSGSSADPGEGSVEVYGNLAARTPSTSEPAPSAETPAEVPQVIRASDGQTPKPVSEPSEPQESPPPVKTEPKGHSAGYTIQVAAHSSRQEAEQTLLRLEAKGFTGRIQAPKAGTGDRFYRVWVGEFETLEQARVQEAEVKAAGFLTYVRKIE